MIKNQKERPLIPSPTQKGQINQMNNTRRDPEISKLFVVLIVLSVTSMIMFVSGQWYFSKKLDEQQYILSQIQERNSDLVNRIVGSQQKTTTPTDTTDETPAIEENTTTKTFKNTSLEYQIEYPKDATVSDDDTNCVTITYKQGYVKIAKKDKATSCLRTVSGTKTTTTEKITIEGNELTAAGYIKKGTDDKLTNHNETLVATLENGNKIEYGSTLDASAMFDDYASIRADIVTIVESYKSL